MQTKNAIGNLVNRYRAVLKKCNLLNTFGSLAIASALALSGAGAAMAENGAEQTDWESDTVSVGGNWEVTDTSAWGWIVEDKYQEEAANIKATIVNVDSDSSLTVRNARLMNYNYIDPENGKWMTLNVNGGNVTLENTSGNLTSIDANIINIKDGTVDITGNGGNFEANNQSGAFLGAYKGLNITGGTINLNKTSQIFGGGENGIQFTGGAINVTDQATAGNSANIQLGGLNNTFGGSAVLSVAASGEATLTMGDALNIADEAQVGVNGKLTFVDAGRENIINQTGGAVSVAANGTLDASALNEWNISGGSVAVAENGSFKLAKETNISGGTLVVNAASVDLNGSHMLVENDGLASFKSLIISNGSNVIVSDFAQEGTSGLVASDGTTVSDGVLAIMKDFDLTINPDLILTGGTLAVDGTIALDASDLSGSAIEAEIADFKDASDITLGNADLTVTKGIQAAEGVTSIATENNALNLGIASGQTDVYKQNFFDTEKADKNHGGTITQKLITGTGAINIAAGTWILGEVETTGSGAFNITGGTGSVEKITTGNGAVSVNGGTLNVTDFTFGAGALTVAGSAEKTGNVTVDGTMDFTGAGTVTVNANGLLDIKDATLANTAAGDVVINSGSVEAQWADFYDTGTNKLKDIVTATGGYLTLHGIDTDTLDAGLYTLDDLANANTASGGGASGTLVSIEGTLVDSDGSVKTEISGQDELDKVHGGLKDQSLVADNSALIVGSSAAQTVGFASADMKNQDLTIDNGSELTIAGDIKNVGDTGVKVENGTLALNDFGQAGSGTVEGKIVEGTGSGTVATKGTYTVTDGISGSTNLTLDVQGGTLQTGETADIAVKTLIVADGAAVSSQNITVTDKIVTGGIINASQKVTATAGIEGDKLQITANELEITSNGAELKNGSGINVDTMTVTAGNVKVGSSNDTVGGASLTVAGKLDLNGNSLLIDPAFEDSQGNLLDSSKVAVMSFGDTASDTDVQINGNIGVGMNSLLSVGTADTADLENALQFANKQVHNLDSSRLTENGFTAAMYIAAPQTLGSGYGIVIDGTKTTSDFSSITPDSLTIAADGLLVVNGAQSQGENGVSAITFANAGSGTVSIDQDATIMLTDVKAGEVKLLSGLSTTANGWGADNDGDRYIVDNILMTAVEKEGTAATSGDLVLTVTAEKAADVLTGMDASLGALVDSFNTDGSNAFLAGALSTTSGMTAAQAAQTIEGAAKAPMVVGAPQTAVSVATQGADYAMARTSFAPRVAGAAAVAENGEYTNISAGDNMANGMNLWIMPMYQNNKADGYKSGAYQMAYDSDFYGVAVGGDYTWDNSFRLGATVNMGTGSAESTGTFAKTENDYDSVGVGIYAGYMLGNLGLSADVNYTNVSNDITQSNSVMALAADGDIDVWSIGARAEYKIATSAMDIIPHIGLRWSNISMDAMNFSGVLTTEADSANVWQLPIGVTFAKDFATESGWNIKPALDLAVIPAFGDTDMAQTVQFAGVNGIASMDTEIMDDVSGRAQLGVEVSKDQFYFGVDYAYQGSSNMDSHGVQANIGFKF